MATTSADTKPQGVSTYSIYIIARIALYREAIAMLFATHDEFRVIGTSTCIDAPRTVTADALLVDYSTISACRLEHYRTTHVGCGPIIAVGVPESAEAVIRLLEAGVTACVVEDSTARELYQAVLDVMAGRNALPASMTGPVLERLRLRSIRSNGLTPSALTVREFEVASLMGEHKSNKEIANDLGISVHTVKVHVHHVIQKLALNRRSQTRDALESLL